MTARAADLGQEPDGKRRRRTPEEIRRRLLDAAQQEFVRKGYAGATTAGISKLAGVAQIQMFRYFPSKAALFREAIFAPLLGQFRAFIADHYTSAGDESARWKSAQAYVRELQAFLKEHARAIVSLYVVQTFTEASQDSSTGGIDTLQRYFEECAALLGARAPGKSELDPGTMVRVAFGAVLGCITYTDWLFPGLKRDEATIDRAVTEFILAGIEPYSHISAKGSDA